MNTKKTKALFVAACLTLLAAVGVWRMIDPNAKSRLIDAHGAISQSVLWDSGTDRVTLGRNGTLFLTDTLEGYAQTKPMTEKELASAANALAELNAALKKQQCELIVLIAPDKCSAYPEELPYYVLGGAGTSDMARLQAALEQRGIPYINALAALQESNERTYHRTDTHWNDTGALIVYRALMARIAGDTVYDAYQNAALTQTQWLGDLAVMARPLSATPEKALALPNIRLYRTAKPMRSLDDMQIETTSSKNGLSLTVSRDSFGKALFPMLANNAGHMVFTRERDMDTLVTLSQGATVLVYELAQRNLRLLLGEEIAQ